MQVSVDAADLLVSSLDHACGAPLQRLLPVPRLLHVAGAVAPSRCWSSRGRLRSYSGWGRWSASCGPAWVKRRRTQPVYDIPDLSELTALDDRGAEDVANRPSQRRRSVEHRRDRLRWRTATSSSTRAVTSSVLAISVSTRVLRAQRLEDELECGHMARMATAARWTALPPSPPLQRLPARTCHELHPGE